MSVYVCLLPFSGVDANSNINFAKGQVDYLTGNNPQNQCFIVGKFQLFISQSLVKQD